MTPENIAGLAVPDEQLKDLLDALAETAEPAPVYELPQAA
jgi:hypothetical protein